MCDCKVLNRVLCAVCEVGGWGCCGVEKMRQPQAGDELNSSKQRLE